MWFWLKTISKTNLNLITILLKIMHPILVKIQPLYNSKLFILWVPTQNEQKKHAIKKSWEISPTPNPTT